MMAGQTEAAVLTAGDGQRGAITAMLARAFADDPAMTYIFPDPAQRARRMPRLFALLFDSDAAAGMRLVSGGGEAATLWRGPGQVHTSRTEMLRQALPMIATFGTALGRALRLSDAIGAHMPAGAFWYLHIAGCDPAYQGRGLGASVVRAGLARASGRTPCYLETATESNIGFYAGLGFAVTGEWRVSGGGPRFWSMLRPAD
jgi:ribosomal protein S18 acetylase RimI-like enzyme